MNSKDIVTCIATKTVHATNLVDLPRRLEFTPWDIQTLLVGPMQRGLLFPKPKIAAAAIPRLEASLSRTLGFYPLLAGRLSRTDNDDGTTSSFSIDCNNSGAQFVHAAAHSVSISDILDPAYIPPTVDSFFPLNDIINLDGVTQPLLGVQVTELADGVFVGITMNHVVGDGTLFWRFFDSWGEIFRGNDVVSRPPFLGRWFLGEEVSPVRSPSEKLGEKNVVASCDSTRDKVYVFEKEKIAELKAKANSEEGTSDISSLQSVLAHVWRSITRCRQLEHDEIVGFLILIGCRARIPFPEDYIGNAFLPGVATIKAGDLTEHGLGRAAREINKIVGFHTYKAIMARSKSMMENCCLISPDDMGKISKYMLGVSSTPRYKVYDVDFGWGRPVAVRCGPSYKANGAMTLFSGVKDGSIEVHTTLLKEDFRALENDSEFMDMVAQ